MKKPVKRLFQRDQLRSIDDVERRLAAIHEMQNLLQREPDTSSIATNGTAHASKTKVNGLQSRRGN